jgi:hypothetical protein
MRLGGAVDARIGGFGKRRFGFGGNFLLGFGLEDGDVLEIGGEIEDGSDCWICFSSTSFFFTFCCRSCPRHNSSNPFDGGSSSVFAPAFMWPEKVVDSVLVDSFRGSFLSDISGVTGDRIFDDSGGVGRKLEGGGGGGGADFGGESSIDRTLFLFPFIDLFVDWGGGGGGSSGGGGGGAPPLKFHFSNSCNVLGCGGGSFGGGGGGGPSFKFHFSNLCNVLGGGGGARGARLVGDGGNTCCCSSLLTKSNPGGRFGSVASGTLFFDGGRRFDGGGGGGDTLGGGPERGMSGQVAHLRRSTFRQFTWLWTKYGKTKMLVVIRSITFLSLISKIYFIPHYIM